MIDVLPLYSHLVSLVLPWIRILAFLQFSPLAESNLIPQKIRVALSLVLIAVLAPVLPALPSTTGLLSVTTLILIVEQIGWGWIFGQLLQVTITSLQSAGQVIAMNMGLSMAAQNDPINGTSNTLVAQLLQLTGMLLFFTTDGHLLLVTILYKSFIYWPIGAALQWPSLQLVVANLGWVLSAALIIALPSTLIMLLIQGVFGLLNKISPSLNLFSLGFPLATLAGLIGIALLLPNLAEHYLSLTNHVIHQFDLLRGKYVTGQ